MELLTKASLSAEANDREKRNLELAYQAACGSAVLLKNDGALPFGGDTVALFGAGASRTIKGGTGSGEVNERHSVSIMEGFTERGVAVGTMPWIEDYEKEYKSASEEYKKRKRKINVFRPTDALTDMGDFFRMPEGRDVTKKDIAGSGTESCVYVISRQAGEGGDRRLEKGDYFLTDRELKNILFCARNYNNFVLVINCGSPMELSSVQDEPEVNAILYISQPGCQGGLAAADLIMGRQTPCGKLADSWARKYSDLPFADEYSYLNGKTDEEYYKEGIFVGYRYFDSFGTKPLYPFGFGLSYTRFRLSKPDISVDGGRVTLKLIVKNTGRRFPGRETVQLYVSPPEGKLQKEYQRLAAFAKTSLLAPGKSGALELSFDIASLASFRFDDASFVLEPGDYVLRLGTCSRETAPVAILRLEDEVVVSRHRHICPLDRPFIGLNAPARPAERLSAKLPVFDVPAGCIATEEFDYSRRSIAGSKKALDFVSGLTVKDMAEIVVGIGMFGGETRFTLPGSVGNTTSKFWDRGLANVTLCDGPAGLRIQQQAAVSDDGKVTPIGSAISSMDTPPKPLRNRKKISQENEPVVYQYATAFPVASALAQSWDMELMYRIGGAIFEEMKEYGCTFWLAPAINIHRNPLCGRNFEYFSEDPFLTGALAGALTRGVQREEGYYVTVKHFACNNQETNRNRVSSNMTERTLREIYLPAFKAVVKSGAKAVMASYNRVNGVYAPASRDLCTDVLRCEWGFDGVVMTDWFSTMFMKEASALAIGAGNDLIMPGEPLSKYRIVRAVKKGLISEEDLRRCCVNVVKAIMNSAIQKEYIDG